MRAARHSCAASLVLPAFLFFAVLVPAGFCADSPAAPPPGSDPEAVFNQPSPEERIRTTFDLETINVEQSLRTFLAANSALVGDIKPNKMTVAAAITAAKAVVAASPHQAALAAARAHAEFQTLAALRNLAAIAVVNQRPVFALGVLLLAEEKFPADPKVRFNLASLLADRGMINEAEALLDDLFIRRTLPEHPFGITATQGADYLRAYLWMREGKIKEAAALLKPIVAANPAFAEADLTYALVEWKLGEDARPPYLMGVWRRPKPSRTAAGEAKDAGEHGPPAKGDETGDGETPDVQEVGVDADLFVDISKGKPGVLPAVPQPLEIMDRVHFLDWARAGQTALKQEFIALAQKRQAAYERSIRKKLPETVRNRLSALDGIIDVENARMPELRVLKRALQKLETEQTETYSRLSEEFGNTRLEIISATGKSEEQKCQEITSLVEKSDASLRARVQGTDYAIRRLHKYWHQYATALGSLTSDPDFREYLALRIQMEDRTAFTHLLANMDMSCAFAIYGVECAKPRPKPKPGLDALGDPELAHCSEADKQHSVGAEISTEIGNPAHVEPVDLTIGVEANCEGVSLEVGAEVVKMLGVSAELEIKRDGTMTVFAGLKGELGSESIKAGGYITMDKDSFQDAGARIVEKNTKSFGIEGVKGTYSTVRAENSISMFPGPDVPAHNESGLRNYPN